MSFTWLRPTAEGGPLRTREQVAVEVHQVSLSRGLDTFATVLTCMGIDVEVGADDDEGNPQWWCPANPGAESASMAYPHDSLSNDGRSCGYLQQQTPWWNTVQDEMTLAHAANEFQARLTDSYHDADNDPHLAGQFVQDVQGSGFPARYQDHWDTAWDVVNRALANDTPVPVIVGPVPAVPPATPVAAPVFNVVNEIGRNRNHSGRGGDTVDLLIIHTQEPRVAPYSVTAQDLADFLNSTTGTDNPVSYHDTIGQNADGSVDVVNVVDLDQECWAVLDSNPDSINVCFAGSSAGVSKPGLSEQEWMDQFGNAIDVAAYLFVQRAGKYGVPIKVLAPPYNSDPPGITDHRYVTEWLGDGSHEDVGNNFPWTYFATRILHYANATGDDDVPLVFQSSASIYRQSNDPLPWAGTPMDFIIDRASHEGRVEQLAKDGDPVSLGYVQAVADGTSPVSEFLVQRDRDQAQTILNLIAAKPAAKSRKVTQK